MTNLIWLSLYDNDAERRDTGVELGNLADLQRLYLHGNMLTGDGADGAGQPRLDLNNLLLMNNDADGRYTD